MKALLLAAALLCLIAGTTTVSALRVPQQPPQGAAAASGTGTALALFNQLVAKWNALDTDPTSVGELFEEDALGYFGGCTPMNKAALVGGWLYVTGNARQVSSAPVKIFDMGNVVSVYANDMVIWNKDVTMGTQSWQANQSISFDLSITIVVGPNGKIGGYYSFGSVLIGTQANATQMSAVATQAFNAIKAGDVSAVSNLLAPGMMYQQFVDGQPSTAFPQYNKTVVMDIVQEQIGQQVTNTYWPGESMAMCDMVIYPYRKAVSQADGSGKIINGVALINVLPNNTIGHWDDFAQEWCVGCTH